VAFSDPNDLLSYAIPHNFNEKYLDSRLCIKVTNVNINVAKIFDAFGMGKFANPMEAHLGYTKDDRVIAMIAKGIGNKQVAPLVKEKCEWTEITDWTLKVVHTDESPYCNVSTGFITTNI